MDGYGKTVVTSTFDDCDILDKAIHLAGNVYNDSMVTIEKTGSRYAKYVYYNYSHIRICKHVRNTKVLLARFPLLF